MKKTTMPGMPEVEVVEIKTSAPVNVLADPAPAKGSLPDTDTDTDCNIHPPTTGSDLPKAHHIFLIISHALQKNGTENVLIAI